MSAVKVKVEPGKCPKCGGGANYPGDIQQEGDGYYQDCVCPRCEFTGAECYYAELTHFCEDTNDHRAVVTYEAEPRRIMVTVEGGLIQAVNNIPPGIVVEVHDYDTDGRELDEEAGVMPDEHGDFYQRSEWVKE